MDVKLIEVLDNNNMVVAKILTENVEISENYKVKFIFSDGSIIEYDKNSKLGALDDKR